MIEHAGIINEQCALKDFRAATSFSKASFSSSVCSFAEAVSLLKKAII
jgi:hypothetical protein